MIAGVLATAARTAEVMNAGGVPYAISNPDPKSAMPYKANFEDLSMEYFDVYSVVKTRYSQVYWTRNPPVDLPADLIERFKGKVMAITGYEVDQVMTDDPSSKTNAKDKDADKSVPIYHAYNHHYFGWLNGKDSEMYKLDEPKFLPNPTSWGVRDLPEADSNGGYPTNIVFKENPGGEYRKSYHGYPRGYAQLLHSPTNFVCEPMQIDTHNREYNATDPVGYKPSFLPKSVLDPKNLANLHSGLSPLIECPCSTRITKQIVNQTAVLTKGTCPALIATVKECSDAVASIAPLSISRTVNNASMASGCSMLPDGNGDAKKAQTYTAFFNTATEGGTCGSAGAGGEWSGEWKDFGTKQKIDCQGACLKADPKYGCTGEFEGQCTWDSADAAKENCGKYEECRGIYCTDEASIVKNPLSKHSMLCFARDTDTATNSGYSGDHSFAKVMNPIPADTLAGTAASLVNLTVAHDGVNATVTLSGPAGAWFAVGFNAKAMADLPYAIVVNGDGTVNERKLVDHGPGSLLKPSVAVVSSTVTTVDSNTSIRTVVLTRAVVGATPDHYTLPSTPGAIDLITAVGNTPTIAYHKARTGTQLTLIPTLVGACLCQPDVHKYFTYEDPESKTKSQAEYKVFCAPEPRGDMLNPEHNEQSHGAGMGKNPACDGESYHGGLHCCHHTWFLTDKEDASKIPPEQDVYYLKWRFYFQEYKPATASAPASHQHLHHYVFLIDERINDYEEVGCPLEENDRSKCIGNITAHITANDLGLEAKPATYSGITPYVMTPHCHAPSCIRQELWNADTNELICGVTGRYGNGTEVYNEANYLALPPCLWGDQPGLQKPITLKPGTKLKAIKYFNNSFRHLGQMAQWTGLMTYAS